MALDQYFEEAVPQIDSCEDKSSLDTWKCASDAIADADHRNASGDFDCNICLECVQDPVVTLCGHLYCWPCIYKWLNYHSISSENEKQQKPQCPVCKSDVSQSSIVPLYGRGQTTLPSEGKAHQVGIVIPRRPLCPAWVVDPPRQSPRQHNPTTVSQPTSQLYHPHSPNHPQQFNSVPGIYTSPMLNTGGSLTNPFDTTFGVYGETIYGRVFGNQVTNIYRYPNSYHIWGNRNPRIRRNLMQADKSLSRICFFLLCCIVLCLLLF